MDHELSHLRPKASSFARVMGAMAMCSLIAPVVAVAQVQAPASARLGVVVDAPIRSLQPGGSAQFMVRVENSGAGQPSGARLQIPVANGLSGQTWTCVAHTGATCASTNGSGTVDQSLGGLSAGGKVEYTLAAHVSANPPAFVDIEASTNPTTSARCAGGQTQPCRSLLSLPTGASLSLDVTSTSGALQPGGQVNYTITTRSHGESGTSGSVLRSPVPNGLTNSRWTCSSSVGACAANSGNGPIDQQLGDFSGAEVRFQISATVASSPPATIVQAAAITPPNGGSCAQIHSNMPTSTAAPCTARKSLATSAKILVTRTPDYWSPAGTVSKRFVLENVGASAGGSVISSGLPQGALELTWSCSAEGAACPQPAGSGAIQHTVGTWPTSGKLIYDIVVRRDPVHIPSNSSVLSVMPPARATCGQAGTPPPCHAVDAKLGMAVFELTQQASRVGALPGHELQYSITLANRTSDTTAHDVVFSAPKATGIESLISWTCSSANPAIACPVVSGSGPINQMYADLVPGSRFTYAIKARVAAAPPATIDARAILVAPATAGMGCASASGLPVPCESSTQFSSVPIFALEQSATANGVSSGGLVNYVLDIFNLGADAGVVNVKNVLPESIAGASWVCAGLGMGCPHSSGSGNISESIAQMPEGSSVRYSVSAQVAGVLPESVSNVLVAAPVAGGRCHSDVSGLLSEVPCSDRIETSFSPILELSQTSAERQLLRGGVVNYSTTLENSGGAPADTRIGMALPQGISHLDWTCSGFDGAVCARQAGSGEIDEAVVGMPAGGHLTYSIRGVVAQDAPAGITNQVTITPAANARCALNGCNASLSLPVTEVPSAHLQISAKSPTPVVQSGGAAVWMVDIRNLGSEVAGEFGVRNAFEDSGFQPRSWTCEGLECPAESGNGALMQTVKSLTVYAGNGSEREVGAGRVVFTVMGMIDRQPDASATFSVSVTPAAGDTCGPIACENTVDVPVEVLGGSLVSLGLASNDSQVFPDSQVNYTFTISNNGGATLNNVTAFSIEPPEFTSISWVCLPFGGAACPTAGTGTINEIIANMPISSGVTFQITANTGSTLPQSIDFQVGTSVEAGVLCVPASCTATLSLPARNELSLTLDSNTSTIIPGGTVDYTFRLENTGGGELVGFNALSIEPAEFASSTWTCVATGGANCMPSGFGPILEPVTSMPPGSSVTFTVTAFAETDLPPTLDFEVQATFGSGPAPAGLLPCNPASCSLLLSLPTGIAIPPTIAISKTADRATLEPGGTVRYNVVVANTGSVDAGNFQLTDAIPPGLVSFTWSCSEIGETGCSSTSGTGDIDEYIEYMAPGSSLTYVIDAVVSAGATGTVTNLARLFPESLIVCVPFSCGVDLTLPVGQSASLDVSKTAIPASGSPVGAGMPISWILRATNSGGATRANLVLTDRIPTNVIDVEVVNGAGVACNTLSPQPGTNLICTIAPGFTGERVVDISATILSGSTGSVTNTVNASGSDNPACGTCTVSNPIVADVDAGIANPRAFVAGSMSGTLFDIVNMSANPAQTASVVVTPASALRFLAPYASGCTATPGTGGSVVVSCPSPPSSQGINCSANTCTIGTLPQNSAATLFVALNAGTSATVQLVVPGDSDASDNTLALPLGGTP